LGNIHKRHNGADDLAVFDLRVELYSTFKAVPSALQNTSSSERNPAPSLIAPEILHASSGNGVLSDSCGE
jgi:hypothetical protein